MNAAPTNESLILPASGLASRIGGIPKALLPCGEAESLLTRHVANAMAASIEPVIVTRSELVEVFRSHVLSVLGIEVPVLAANTANMTQTVSVALVHLPDIEVFSVFLPDTFIDPPPPVIELHNLASTHGAGLLVVPTRPDQVGKLGGVAFARDGTVESIKDKTQENRFSTHHRAAMSFSRESYVKFHNLGDPHVGMSMERYIAAQGRAFAIVQSDAAYYDFGTFAEVQAFMSRALL